MGLQKGTNYSETKLQRLLEYNRRLEEQLKRERVPVSVASDSLIQYVSTTRDYLVPSVWNTAGTADPFNSARSNQCAIL
ncbi:uncharacterized protein VTP21DRAFT_6573 [Calcarisporiella thermophila]|uniref:uncharacterized protein n=1 Tax=Calcarisporiella thermophila TaxID=911321 RepID=UPI0037422F4B